MFAQYPEAARSKQLPRSDATKGKHRKQSRQNAPCSTLIECGDADASRRCRLFQQHSPDQIPGDDKEYVDAEVTTRKKFWESVETEHRRDCDGAQSVDVTAINRF